MKIVLLALISLIIISGCIQGSVSNDSARLPNAEVDATVLSLSLTDVDEDPNDLMWPRDKAVIRIDKIYSSDGLELNVGDEVNVEFGYSARPVIFRKIPTGEPLIIDPDEDKSASVTQEFIIEDGVFVYLYTSNIYDKVTEESLPGLEVGTKVKAIMWQRSSNEFNINKYELK